MEQVHDTPDKIETFRLRVMIGALKLEIKGMKRRGRQVSGIIRKEFGFLGDKDDLLVQMQDLVSDRLAKEPKDDV